MSRIFLKLISIVFLISCSDNEEVQNTEIITDSYYFQKKVFNVNLYNCITRNDKFSANHLITTDRLSQIRLSEIVEDKNWHKLNLLS
mgnify:CR=1 FL=1